MPHQRKKLEFKDSDLWYVVGLIATDGCLSKDGQHIDITSKNREFLEEIKKSLGLHNKIGSKRNKNKEYFRIQIGNRNFYEFLLSIGLTPKKSLTLGELKIPELWFSDFLRGVIDGDGCIRKWIHPSNGREQWSLRIYSGSPVFIYWLGNRVENLFFAKGKIHKNNANVLSLKFGKMAAKKILGHCYYDGSLSLNRKAKLAEMCGTSVTGWSKCKTLLCTV